MNRKLKAAVSHHDREVAELRVDRELAIEYLKAAMESLDNPNDRAAAFLRCAPLQKRMADLWRFSLKPGSAANRFAGRYLQKGTRP